MPPSRSHRPTHRAVRTEGSSRVPTLNPLAEPPCASDSLLRDLREIVRTTRASVQANNPHRFLREASTALGAEVVDSQALADAVRASRVGRIVSGPHPPHVFVKRLHAEMGRVLAEHDAAVQAGQPAPDLSAQLEAWKTHLEQLDSIWRNRLLLLRLDALLAQADSDNARSTAFERTRIGIRLNGGLANPEGIAHLDVLAPDVMLMQQLLSNIRLALLLDVADDEQLLQSLDQLLRACDHHALTRTDRSFSSLRRTAESIRYHVSHPDARASLRRGARKILDALGTPQGQAAVEQLSRLLPELGDGALPSA